MASLFCGFRKDKAPFDCTRPGLKPTGLKKRNPIKWGWEERRIGIRIDYAVMDHFASVVNFWVSPGTGAFWVKALQPRAVPAIVRRDPCGTCNNLRAATATRRLSPSEPAYVYTFGASG